MNNQNEFASVDLTVGQINAIVKKIGGYDKALAFLRGELIITEPERKWREQDGIIYLLPFTSDGTTGEEWIELLLKADRKVSDRAKEILRSSDFHPTSGITTEVVVLKGMLFSDDDRITKNIRAKAAELNLTVPNAEAACFIRLMFTDKELETMGLWWIAVMHEPIADSDGNPRLLLADRDDDDAWLSTSYDSPAFWWDGVIGFAFAGAQVALEV
jgi:hypothetical protein